MEQNNTPTLRRLLRELIEKMKKNQLEIISKIRHKIVSEEKHLVKVEIDRDILKV